MQEDNSLTRTASNGLASHSSDVENDPITFQLVQSTKKGALTLNTDGSFTYTPNKDYFGTDTFYFKAYDGQLYSNNSYYAINVTPVNDAPVISDSINLNQVFRNQQIIIDLDKYIFDVDDPLASLIVKEIKTNTRGNLSITNNRLLNYLPDRNYFGLDSITLSVSDGKLISEPKTIKFIILNDNIKINNEIIRLYPNPSNGRFIIKDLLIDAIYIYDINGNRILNFNYTKVGANILVNINNVPMGNYIIQLSYKNQLIGFKNIIITPQ